MVKTHLAALFGSDAKGPLIKGADTSAAGQRTATLRGQSINASPRIRPVDTTGEFQSTSMLANNARLWFYEF